MGSFTEFCSCFFTIPACAFNLFLLIDSIMAIAQKESYLYNGSDKAVQTYGIVMLVLSLTIIPPTLVCLFACIGGMFGCGIDVACGIDPENSSPHMSIIQNTFSQPSMIMRTREEV